MFEFFIKNMQKCLKLPFATVHLPDLIIYSEFYRFFWVDKQ